jgi:hypothetical protein
VRSQRIAPLLVLALVAGCSSSDELSLRSSCRRFLDAPMGERAEFVTELFRGRNLDHGTVGIAQALVAAEEQCEAEPDRRLDELPAFGQLR